MSVFHSSPNYSKLKIFGCLCYPWLRLYNTHKLEQLSKACLFLGYSNLHNAYICFDPIDHKFYYSRHVQFVESIFPSMSTCTNHDKVNNHTLSKCCSNSDSPNLENSLRHPITQDPNIPIPKFRPFHTHPPNSRDPFSMNTPNGPTSTTFHSQSHDSREPTSMHNPNIPLSIASSPTQLSPPNSNTHEPMQVCDIPLVDDQSLSTTTPETLSNSSIHESLPVIILLIQLKTPTLHILLIQCKHAQKIIFSGQKLYSPLLRQSILYHYH